MESLEDRRLLAADVSFEVDNPFEKEAVSLESVIERTKTMDYMPGELIVAVQVDLGGGDVQDAKPATWENLLQDQLVTPAKTILDFSTSDTSWFELVHIDLGPDANVLQAMREIESSPDVLWSEPNFVHRGADVREYVPNDPRYGQQYHHALIGSEAAWDVTFGDSDIVIAITDDGVDLEHEDLAASIWVNPGEVPGDGIDNDNNGFIDDVNGYNFLNNNNNPDASGPGDDHGTHVAGIAAGLTDNGIGIAGTAGGATIMPIKWYDGGSWTAAMVANSFTYAADNGANIVNSSYNFDIWAGNATVHAAFDYMHDNGVLHFVSAGNSSALNSSRQEFEQTLIVGATGAGDSFASFSNRGTGVDVTAPGDSVLSSTPGNTYSTFSGTSMAAPNAAGVAAMIWSANPTWNRDEVVSQLMATADDITSLNPTLSGLLGNGRVSSGRGVTMSVMAPQVANITNIPESGFATAQDSIEDFMVDFSQYMDGASVLDASVYELRDSGSDGVFDTADDQVYTLSVDTSDYKVGTDGVQLSIDGGPLGIGEYRLTVGASATNPFGIQLDGNADGVAGDGYEAFLTISIEPFVETGLIAGQGAVSAGNPGSLANAADSDSYNFFVEAGESVTAIVRPTDPTATLTGEFASIGASATAAAPGDAVIVPLKSVPTDGNLSFTVSGDKQTGYQFDVYRNVNVQDLVNPSGDAVDIDDSRQDFGFGTSRLAAMGQSNGLLAGTQFVHFNDPTAFVDISGTGTPLGLSDDGEATITTTVGNSAFPSGPVTVGNNGAIVATANASVGVGNTAVPSNDWTSPALMPFWDDIDSDSGDVYWQETQVDGIPALIVQWDSRPRYSNIGDSTFQLQLLESGPVLARYVYQDVDFGDSRYDDGASATIGYQSDSSTGVEFSRDTAAVSNGDVLELVNTSSSDDVEEYDFSMQPGESVDVALQGISRSFSAQTMELIDPSGAVVATAVGSLNGVSIANADLAINGYQSVAGGDYSVRLTSSQTATYSLVVAEDLVFDLEPNGDIANARSLDPYSGALGHLVGGSISHIQYNDASAFVDISGSGNFLNLGDDTETTIVTSVGNPSFPAGPITVANNGGIIAAGGEDLSASNGSLPNSSWDTALLPFWDDIDATNGGVYWQELQVNGINTLVVQWHERPHYSNTGAATFQVQVFESGPLAFRFAYRDVEFGSGDDNGASATVGVQLSPGVATTISQNNASLAANDVIDIAVVENDIYSFTVAPGDTLALQTETPLDHPDNLVRNVLDPNLTLMDASGNTVALDDNSAPDGKNASLSLDGVAPGTYYVAVGLDAGGGEYVLNVLRGLVPIDGDFNDDGIYDCEDVDALVADIAAGNDSAVFDLTSDGMVDRADLDAWLVEGGEVNLGPGRAYLYGDANLDGVVDTSDLNRWSANKFTTTAAWCDGDFNADGVIDTSDLNLWSANKFQSSLVIDAGNSGGIKTARDLSIQSTDQIFAKVSQPIEKELPSYSTIDYSTIDLRRSAAGARLAHLIDQVVGEDEGQDKDPPANVTANYLR